MLKRILGTLMLLAIITGLAACGPQNIINDEAAIRAVKQAAASLASPPRTHDVVVRSGITLSSSVTKPNEANIWPDTPITASLQLYNLTPLTKEYEQRLVHPLDAGKLMTMTLQPHITANTWSGGVDVTFTAYWAASEHSWQFHVDSALVVSFGGEQGQELRVLTLGGLLSKDIAVGSLVVLIRASAAFVT